MSTASVVLDLASARGPRCGDTTVVLIDGPAGSGKTTLAAAVADAASHRGAPHEVIHMDDLYPGWDGLLAGGDLLTCVLDDLASGAPARYARYDWHQGCYTESVPVRPGGLLVAEGVGSVRTAHAGLASVIVWVAEPETDERLRRGLARDGVDLRDQWLYWMASEAALFAAVGTSALADIVIDGVGSVVENRADGHWRTP